MKPERIKHGGNRAGKTLTAQQAARSNDDLVNRRGTAAKPPWHRYRFQANADDYRPIKWPPPGPFWCTGSGEGYSIVVAYLPPSETLTDYWPEAAEVDREDRSELVFTDRFPKPDWWNAKTIDDVKPVKTSPFDMQLEECIAQAKALEQSIKLLAELSKAENPVGRSGTGATRISTDILFGAQDVTLNLSDFLSQ